MVQRCSRCQQILPPLGAGGGVVQCPRCGSSVEPATPTEDTSKAGTNLEGLTLGGYRVGTLLGVGPRGLMYVGEQIRLSRVVTLKFLATHLVQNEVSVEDFVEAGRKASSLIHPNIIKVYDAIQERGYYAIAGEFNPGISLDGCVAGGEPLSPRAIIQIGVEAADALRYAHEQGLCHGNICPSNLLRAPNGKILLTDFCHSPFETPGVRSTRIRQLRALFIPPELCLGKAVTPLSDIFSLGAALFYALATYPPYSVEEFGAMLEDPSAVPAPSLPPTRRDVPPPLINLLRDMLAPDPAARPPSMEAVTERLETALEGFRARVKKTATQMIVQKARDMGPVRRRLYKRLPTDMEVTVVPRSTTEQIADLFLSKIANLSENGCFVATPKPLPIGTFVNLEFKMNESLPAISVLGLVRWVEEDPDRPGMGVQFLEVSAEERKEIRHHVDERVAVDMCRSLTRTPLHRAVLKMVLGHWDRDVSIDQFVHATRASKPLVLRTLSDFEEFHLVQVRGVVVRCIRPGSRRLISCLVSALAGLDSGPTPSESPSR